MIHPWRVNRLINAPELRVLLQPALCFPAFVDNVVVHDQRDGFRPTVCRFKPLQQADEQRRTFAVAAHITDFTCPAVQRSGQIIFFILSRRDHPFLLSAQLPVRTDFGMKMDIHFIFIKDRMLCAARPVLYGLRPSFHLYAGHGYAELAQPFATQSPQTATSGERFQHLTGNRLSH